MKKAYINNFCDCEPLEVNSGIHPTCGPLVNIRQNAGACSFQHSMTADQAREMAAALLDAVGELEADALAKGMAIVAEEVA